MTAPGCKRVYRGAPQGRNSSGRRPVRQSVGDSRQMEVVTIDQLADQIAEQHRELAAFGAFGSPAGLVTPCRGTTALCRSRLSL